MKIFMSALLAILGLVQLTESKVVKIEKVSVEEVETFAGNCSTEHDSSGHGRG